MGKRRSLPLALVGVTIVLMLGTVGVAYGLWSKTLFVNGTVHTGSVDAMWSFVGCYDIETKEVGSTIGQIVDPANLSFTIVNGYPSYTGGL